MVTKNTDIALWLNCTQCVKERPPGMSPEGHNLSQAGIKADGTLVVWCHRHDMLICEFDSDALADLAGQMNEKMLTCDPEDCSGHEVEVKWPKL